jgi:2-polyprenyl-3-methyl-5-hydroxy-6-metoxy-1,4-benzoquinol methylase
MTDLASIRRKLLVVIASYGNKNDKYLERLIDEYRLMPFITDIVVLSNIPKDMGSAIEVIVGLPTNNPWSLPFAHKQLFVDRSERYDLFIYSEDDTLITHRNIEAFLRVSDVLADDEIAGYLRFEHAEDGRLSYPDVHHGYHWDPQSVRSRGEHTFAFFTNEHAAAYILTRRQLQRAVASGGFLVPPHQGKYDMLCTAATDPYTQCGFTKLICVSQLRDFMVHHLPNKYVGKLGVDACEIEYQTEALLTLAAEGDALPALLGTHPELKASAFWKNYYEPIRTDLLSLIPTTSINVLSVGCGWGATEERLVQNGKKVVAIALDPVISACARRRGVNVVDGDMNDILAQLAGERFDCLLISNLLHLVRDPGELLASLALLLSDRATCIASVPNLVRLPVQWRKLRGVESYRFLGDYEKSGIHLTSHRVVRKWLGRAGLKLDRFTDVLPTRTVAFCHGTLGLMVPFLSSEIVAVSTQLN